MKASVRTIMENARENSEKINFTANQQQRLSVILHELSGTVSTDTRSSVGSSSVGSSSARGSKNSGGDNLELAVLSPSRPMLHPLEGTYVHFQRKDKCNLRWNDDKSIFFRWNKFFLLFHFFFFLFCIFPNLIFKFFVSFCILDISFVMKFYFIFSRIWYWSLEHLRFSCT